MEGNGVAGKDSPHGIDSVFGKARILANHVLATAITARELKVDFDNGNMLNRRYWRYL